MHPSSIGVFAVILCGFTSIAFARETPIHENALPTIVRDSLRSLYPGATILHLSRDMERGAVLYEAEITLSGRRIDALFDSHGRLREEEARIPAGELPEPVRSAIRRAAGGKGVIIRAERLTSAGRGGNPQYEVLVSRRGTRKEYIYSADGRPLKTQGGD